MLPYQNRVNEIMPTWIGKMNGRPHWAKNWQYIEPRVDMKALYPAANLDKFNTLRRRLDPDGMFINNFLKKKNLFW
jgi:hypothetical protein